MTIILIEGIGKNISDLLKDKRNKILFWDKLDVPSTTYSLPKLVEKWAESLRADYLRMVYNIGLVKVFGKTLREHLELEKGFSFWWMTLLTEKNPRICSNIYDIFRLRVLEILCEKHNFNKLILYSSNKRLSKVLSEWCRNKNVIYIWEKQKKSLHFPTLKEIYYSLPAPLIALIYLFRYLKRNFLFLKISSPAMDIMSSSQSFLTIISYFFHLDNELIGKGIFKSSYWNDLPRLIMQFSTKIIWLLKYIPSSICPSPNKALKLKKQFSHNHQNELFFFLEEWLSITLIFEAIKYYLLLFSKSLKLGAIKDFFYLPNSQVNLWEFLKKDWFRSIRGDVALYGCLQFCLFESALSKFPRQKIGLYSQENQSWERALIYKWRKYRHGNLIGVQHSTVRFFDLRYFENPQIYYEKNISCPQLQPDIMAVNGEQAKKLLLLSGFPSKNLEVVEVLRYQYLSNRKIITRKITKESVLLVATDYTESDTINQLKILASAINNELSKKFKILIKSHPNLPVEHLLQKYVHKLEVNVVNTSLKNIIPYISIAYVSNATSAALEFTTLGIPTIIALSPTFFNMSPLRGEENIMFVSNGKELREALRNPLPTKIKEKFFYLDGNLKKWKNLLMRYIKDE